MTICETLTTGEFTSGSSDFAIVPSEQGDSYTERLGVIEEVGDTLESWKDHYSSEPANWPEENVEFWSVQQTLLPHNLYKYGMADGENRETATQISQYLLEHAGSGTRRWLDYKRNGYEFGMLSEAERLVFEIAQSLVLISDTDG